MTAIAAHEPTVMPPLPPQDMDAEMALIGAMLMSPEAVDQAVLALPEGDAAFNDPRHAQLWRAILTIHNAGQPIDYLVVTDWLRKADCLEKVGGAAYTIELAESFAEWANVAHYARIVREKHHYRRVIWLCHNAAQRAYSAMDDASNIVADLTRELDALTGNNASLVVERVKLVIETLAAKWQGDRSKKGKPPILSRFPLIDRHVGGFERPSMIVIGARPSAGKTSLATAFALSAVREGVNVLFVSLETATARLCGRIVSQVTERAINLLRADSPENQAHYLRAAADHVTGKGEFFVFDYTRTRNLREIISLCRAMARRENIGLIIVDYLQKMQSRRRDENRTMEVTDISDALQTLAAQTGTCVIALSQFHRETAGILPSLGSLRESGAIEQDADMVLLLHRDERVEKQGEPSYPVMLQIAKWKDGPTSEWLKLKFEKATLRFFYQPNAAYDDWELIGIPKREQALPF